MRYRHEDSAVLVRYSCRCSAGICKIPRSTGLLEFDCVQAWDDDGFYACVASSFVVPNGIDSHRIMSKMRGGPRARAPRTMSWGHRTARPPTPPSGVESLPLPSLINQPTLFIFSSTYLWKFQPLVPKLARFASLCYVTAVI